jgi:hypothetical protein
MRISSLTAALFALVSCGAGDDYRVYSCTVSNTEPAISPSTISSLGFSAEEVLATLDFVTEVSALDRDRTPSDARTFTFSFSPASEVWVEEREQAVNSDHSQCLVGTNLVVPGRLTVETSDGWFSGEGDATLTAKAPSPDSAWIRAAFEVDANESLRDEAMVVRPPCAGEDLNIVFVQSARDFAPWVSGPWGGLESNVCDGISVLYGWGVDWGV